jgi:glycosyltransferase involved in cell wall biosynthesis
MLYPAADSLAFEADIPYVVAIHDLQHRLQPEFAEVSADGEWEDREYLYRNATRHATLILAESEVGREDILQCYGVHGVGRDRVKVLRYCPAPYLTGADPERLSARARAVYQLPERYLFYPANFWPSKNHVGLVRALGQLRERHDLCVPLVLSGSRVGALRERTFRDMMTVADGVGVTEQVRYLGWVPDDLIAGLFAGATAMVMPTYFGPTNLPAVEAWSFGCPVLTSRLRGIAEQVGDAGLLANPASVEEIADGIRRLWTDERLRAELARRGRERCDAYTEADFQVRFASIMEEAIRRVDAAGRGRP